MKRARDILMGSVITIFVFVLSTTVFAAYNRSLSVTYADIKISVNGIQTTPKDAQGNTIEPFIYNGTTYLPVRAVADSLGCDVKWNQQTKTVLISDSNKSNNTNNTNNTNIINNDNNSAKSVLNFVDNFEPYTYASQYEGYPTSGSDSLLMGGVSYKNSFSLEAGAASTAVSFNISGKYTLISGLAGIADTYKSGTKNATINFYGDGNFLKTVQITAGSLPQSFSLDITGVSQLKIENGGGNIDIGLSDLKIQ